MSDQGDKTCPLCAEEMDLTDQQLKPCKCGYEICVWCWHHIMDMAEKENTEGRCPACRTPYNKEKIVGMAAKCDKVVADMSTEKRSSSRKGKSKTADSRKQLSSVRVIQRNLVYIVGLPLSLADEDLLQRKEYFSQYGKVMKVSISRTASGAIQHFANDTCSVYITYSKEDEAILCIQSVHGFVLDGRPLRACFGTTKYCHAWLRNVPCTNPDCLYLHEIGSQDDSFTKDEIVSAYTRSRVQQIAGAVNSMQRRSGSVLPPPAEEYGSNSSASADKPISKNAATNSVPSVRGSGSPPNSSSGRSVALPAGALWGTRASNNQHPPASVPCSNRPINQKPQMCNTTVFSTAVESTCQDSLLPAYAGKKLVHAEESGTTQEKGKIETLEPVKHLSKEPVKQHAVADPRICTSENPTIPVPHASSSMDGQLHSAKDKDKHMIPTSSTNAFDISVKSNGPGFTKDPSDTTDVKIQNVCVNMSSLSVGRHKKSQGICIDQNKEPLPSELASADEICISKEKSDLRLDTQSKVTQVATPEMEDDLLTFNEQRHRDPEVITEKVYSPNLSLSLRSPAQPSGYSPQLTNGGGPVRADMPVDRKTDLVSQPSHESSTNGYLETVSNCVADLQTINRSYYLLPDEVKMMHVERFQGEAPSENSSTNVDIAESSIISNILSLDFDPWNESLTSPQNLAKLLGETDDQQGSLRVSSSRKLISNQSRFSFAREEPTNPSADYQPSLNYIEQSFNHYHHGHDFTNSRNYQLDNIGTCNGFSVANNEGTVGFGNSFSLLSSDKLSVSRPQMSAPPGFSTPNRAPPPGFTSHYERMEQNFDSFHGSHLRDTSSLHNLHQDPQVGNVSDRDIEFMDPAILAVGKGRLPNGLHLSSLDMSSSCPPRSNTFENEGRFQLLMKRSLTPHQNQTFADTGDMFSLFNGPYRISSRVVEQTMANNQPPFDGISSRVLEQTLANNQSPFDGISSRVLEQTLANNQSPFSQLTLPQSRNSVMTSGHWDSWNGVQSGNSLNVAELLRTENVGFNKFFTGYEESKIHMPNSANLYNRTFGM